MLVTVTPPEERKLSEEEEEEEEENLFTWLSCSGHKNRGLSGSVSDGSDTAGCGLA